MNTPLTLRQISEQHPDWLDLPLVLLNQVGEIEYVGASAFIYPGEDYNDTPPTPVLIVTSN